MHLQVALASQGRGKAQLISVDVAKAGISGVVAKAAAKHKLKSTKKKPLSLYTAEGVELKHDEDVQELAPGQLLLLVASEGDRKEMERLALATVSEQSTGDRRSLRAVALENGLLPEELWQKVFRFLKPRSGPDGIPIHLLFPPSSPTIVPVAVQVCQLFHREIPKLFAYAGQWFWTVQNGKAPVIDTMPGVWQEYEPRANSDIELCFMRGERSRTVEVSGQDDGPKGRQRHVGIDFDTMSQRNLSKKGAVLTLRRWPGVAHVPPSQREPVCQIEVVGHGNIYWYAYESPGDAVDRFFRGFRGCGHENRQAQDQFRLQIYRFLRSAVEGKARVDQVAVAIAELLATSTAIEAGFRDLVQDEGGGMRSVPQDPNSHVFTSVSKVAPKKTAEGAVAAAAARGGR